MSRLKNLIDLTGQKFGYLTVLEYAGSDNGTGALWLCKCECGREKAIRAYSLRKGNTTSCGCYRIEKISQKHDKPYNIKSHGMSRTRVYNNWQVMIQRCCNPNFSDYPNWGGRGITVCDEWRDSFTAFYDYVSKLEHFEEKGYTLDRIDNDGNYEYSNVRWATAKQQLNNRRRDKISKANTSGVAGVCYVKSRNKWLARISVKGKDINLGKFDTIEAAAEARRAAEIKYLGKVAE